MSSRVVVVLLGPPGAGKGTQAKMLADHFSFVHISTGDILREAVRAGTELGQKVRQVMEAGRLVPDELMSEVAEQKLESEKRNILLDGYPRTLMQADHLDRITRNSGVDAVNIQLGEEEIVKRLSGRRSCVKCGKIYNVYFSPPDREGICSVCGSELVQRKDDREEVVRERLRVYREQTEPVIEFYQSKGRYTAVDGSKEVEAVFQDLTKVLKSFNDRL